MPHACLGSARAAVAWEDPRKIDSTWQTPPGLESRVETVSVQTGWVGPWLKIGEEIR
jgi:hypothetical protein